MEEEKIRKATYYLAKYLSLSNAAEFIRSHGEEGHSFFNDELNESYLKSNGILYQQLEKRSLKYLKKYKEIGVEIDSQVDLE